MTNQCNLQIQCSPYQSSNHLSAEMEKPVIKFLWNCKGPQIAKTVLGNKKTGLEDFTLPSFKTYYKVTVIKTVVLA